MDKIEKIQDYPICDTDIWIKVSNIENCELFFCEYNELNIAEVVQNEIKIVSKEKGFSAFDNFKYYKKNKKLNLLKFSQFNEEEKNAILHLFSIYNVSVNEKGILINDRKKDKGETVSLIYASVLNIPIILSDDKNEIFNDFDIEKINLRKFLERKYSSSEIDDLVSKANVANGYQKNDLEEFHSSGKGKFKDIKNLCKILRDNIT